MVKCLECGSEKTILQTSHFKFKCNGKYLTSGAYKQAYPEAKLMDDELVKNRAITLENMIKKYGLEKGQQKFDEYRNKQSLSNKFEYKQKKHGWTKEKFDEYNSSRAVTIENLIMKHGEKEGVIKWQNYCERQAYTNGLEYFKEKYGEEEGLEKWLDLNKEKGKSFDPKWISESLNISFDDALIVLSNRYTKSGMFISNTEKCFVDDLLSRYTNQIKYTYKTRQYCIWNNITWSPNFYDVCCTKQMKIIEYCGDYWHTNPKKYSPDFFVKQRNMTAKEVWESDYSKILMATQRGFKVKIIWESDYFENGIHDALKFMEE